MDTFRYQVSQEKVSIHLPVCRLLAGERVRPEEHQGICSADPHLILTWLFLLSGLHVLLSRTEVASRLPEQLPLVSHKAISG